MTQNNIDFKDNKLKVYLHILETCNYNCKHCFAHFNSNKILFIDDWKKIIDNCLKSTNIQEFNIAGGEPLLHKDLIDIAKYINYKNIKCSLITNGFSMTNEWIKQNAKYFSTIGFSIDSFEKETLIKIGRNNTNGEILSKERFKEICDLIKENNPKCNIKINTVVTLLNKNECLSKIIKELNIQISRWKIFKMDIFKNDFFDNSNLQVTNQQYYSFIKRNMNEIDVIYEDNIINNNISNIFYDKNGMEIIIEKDVNASYIMIDANGYLVDDSKNDNYTNIINCLIDDFSYGLNILPLNKELYFSRYEKE